MNKNNKINIVFTIIFLIMLNFAMISNAATLDQYKDIESNFASQYIKDLISLQKIDGYENNTILPDNLITRAEFSKILVEAMNIDKNSSGNSIYFKDVNPSDWFYDYVTTMKELEIIDGYDDGTFMPQKNISRAEMLAMIVRISGNNIKVINSPHIYKDVKYNYWGYRDITKAAKSGLIAVNGYYLNPDQFVTRGEVFFSIDKMLWTQKSEYTNTTELINFIKDYNSNLDEKYNLNNSNMDDMLLDSFGNQSEVLEGISKRNNLYARLGIKVVRENKISNPEIADISKDLVKISFDYELSEKIILKSGIKGNEEIGKSDYYLINIDGKWHVYRISNMIKPQDDSQNKINLTWDYMSYESSKFKGGKIEGLDVLSPTWFSLSDSNGTVKSIANKEYVDFAHQNGYKVWALVSNDFDKERTSQFLKSSDARKVMIDSLINFAIQYNLDGINVDFENMKIEDRDLFSEFVRELSLQTDKKNIVLSVDVTVITLKSNWSECYDRETLSQYVDYVAVMTYDQHWSTSPESGSVAQLSWVETEIAEILNQVPNDKLLLGLPFYSRLWKEVNGSVTSKTISMEVAQSLIKENNASKVWDKTSGQYYAEYTIDDAIYKIWVEDAKSIELKSDLVEKYSLAGVGSWRYGFETQDIWNIINNNLE